MLKEYSWIQTSFANRGGTVGSIVPTGFESVVRIDAPEPDALNWWKKYEELFSDIFDVVIRFTSTPSDCRFAIWEGHGFGEIPSSELPKLVTPERSYRVFDSPLMDIKEFRYPEIQEWRNPDLVWPSDRSWFVGTDVDYWAIYVGGSRQMTKLLAEKLTPIVHLVQYQTQIVTEI
jgi:hypothetical protein